MKKVRSSDKIGSARTENSANFNEVSVRVVEVFEHVV
jgi:hypothetical protein